MADQARPDVDDLFFDQGAWMIGSIGDILKLIADYGHNDYFIYRVRDMAHKPTDTGFVRRLDVYSIPIEAMPEMIQVLEPRLVTHMAKALLDHYGVLPGKRPVSPEKLGEKTEPKSE